MKVPRYQLARVIYDQLKQADDLQQFALELAAYLLSEGRIGELDSIMRDVMQLRAEDGTLEVIAVDAFALSDTVKEEVRSLMKRYFPDAKDIIISESKDASMIGGTKLILANQQLDISIRAKLNRFKQLTAISRGA
jgi:F0F1-type ATP synthase delta subunit